MIGNSREVAIELHNLL